jgi:hypothetical protein
VLAVVVIVKMVEPEPLSWVGLKDAVVPASSPEAAKLTVPLNPAFVPTEIV